jgi:hypothetical protein
MVGGTLSLCVLRYALVLSVVVVALRGQRESLMVLSLGFYSFILSILFVLFVLFIQ